MMNYVGLFSQRYCWKLWLVSGDGEFSILLISNFRCIEILLNFDRLSRPEVLRCNDVPGQSPLLNLSRTITRQFRQALYWEDTRNDRYKSPPAPYMHQRGYPTQFKQPPTTRKMQYPLALVQFIHKFIPYVLRVQQAPHKNCNRT